MAAFGVLRRNICLCGNRHFMVLQFAEGFGDRRDFGLHLEEAPRAKE